MSRTIKPLRLLLLCFAGTALFLCLVAKAAAASMVEYALLLVAVLLLAASARQAPLPPATPLLVAQLETAAEGARAANIVGNSVAEISRLSKAIGAAEALMGMTSACSDCGDLRATLQQVIGYAALLKTSAVGASGSCQPNGFVQPTEQCDPLAVPNGCPVNATAVTYCSDECRCEITIVP